MAITYKRSGVDYDLLDPLKIFAQKQGILTSKNILNTAFKEIRNSRGESAYVIEAHDCYFAFITEGLGTKNIVADQMRKFTKKTYYDVIAYDTVISIVMDISVVGAKPLVVSSYWAIGGSEWLQDKHRLEDLIRGWKMACDEVGAVWGGGETPVLKGIVNSQTIDLAGAAFGVIKPKKNLILGSNLSDGDSIVLFESSGIHVNGLTLARKVADKLRQGYLTKLSNGRFYGEELLTPTKSYTNLVLDLLKNGIGIHYMVNITGHGWRKLMRAKKTLTYNITNLGKVSEIFKFIQKETKLSNKEMYGTFNMGAGFAIFVNPKDGQKVIIIAEKHNIKAWIGGEVNSGRKQVKITPLDITYLNDELKISL